MKHQSVVAGGLLIIYSVRENKLQYFCGLYEVSFNKRVFYSHFYF